MKRTITLLSLLLINVAANAWVSMSTGLTGGKVKAMVMFNNKMVVAGDFSNFKRVAQFDGTTWSQVGDGLGSGSDRINCLVVHNSKLYAGGSFSATGTGTTCSNIAVYDPTTQLWKAIGTGLIGEVNCL